MTILIGVDIGQRTEPSAICVAVTENRDGPHGTETHYVVRFLERLPVGTSYPDLADRAAEVSSGISARAEGSPYVYLNVTGLGESVVELFSARSRKTRIVAVYCTPGDRRERVSRNEVRLGKAFLVAQLQTLLQVGRLHLPRTPEAEELARDLLEFEIPRPEVTDDRFALFRVGPRDDLITALALAIQPEPRRLQVF